MATRPEFPAQFAYLDVDLPGTGNDNKLRPNIEVRETGYDYLQKPPAEEFNWLMNNIGQWIQYLDELTRDQGITEVATKAQAEEGVASDVLMTPERTLQSIQYNSFIPGEVKAYAGAALPTGFLRCEGQAVSRTTYSRLFSAIGTTYGAGDGSTTFNLPDLRDDFIRGAHAGRPVGARENYAIQSHSHTGTTNSAGNHRHSLPSQVDSSSGDFYVEDAVGDVAPREAYTGYAGTHTHSFSTNTTGGPETRPRNVAMYWIIKF